MIEHLKLSPQPTTKGITVADGSVTTCDGALNDIPVSFGDHSAKLNFLVVEDPPSDMLIGIVAIRSMRATLEFDNLVMYIPIGDGVVTVGLETDPSRAQYFGKATDSGEFTSDPDAFSIYSTSEESMHVLELEADVPEIECVGGALGADVIGSIAQEDADVLSQKVEHLHNEDESRIMRLLQSSGTMRGHWTESFLPQPL